VSDPTRPTPEYIAFAGPPGSGKTTSALITQRLLPGAVLLSVAAPLRDIEEYVYRRMGRLPPSVTGTQDGQLLQAVRAVLLERDPDFLRRDFLARIAASGRARPVINDDCRLAMYGTLRERGFRFVWVEGNHMAARRDSSRPRTTSQPHDAVLSVDQCDDRIDNNHGLSNLVGEVSRLLTRLWGPDDTA
jgi:hypothetical protein